MSDHIRTQHRARIAAHATAAGFAYVRINATTDAEESRLPAVEIDTLTDAPAKTDNGSWPVQYREHAVRVQIKVKASGDVGKTMDNLVAPFTAAVAADTHLNGLAKITRLAEESYERDELDKPVGVLSQTWLIEYRVNQTSPTAAVS